ncbi:MAG: sigma-54 dependent transcriptional regulator [Planctomycetota bacterium]
MSSERATPSSSSLSGVHNPSSALKRRVLILDDEPAIQQLLKIVLLDENYDVLHTDDGREALNLIAKQPVDLIIQDLRMPKMDGLTFLRLLKDRYPDIPSIVITAFGTFETAIEAMRLGAYTHLNKPFDTEEIRLVVSRALERLEISKKSPRANVPFLDIISNTSLISDVVRLVNRIAPTDSTVLITGESGTGKELIARAIHFKSLRSDQAFVPINCGAFTETLLEAELFGHLKGSFTGAIADHKGVFESADRGTLFLDEVGDLSLSTQIKLLRVLESRMVKPVGGTRETKVDVRFIAATNRHLAQMVADGQFREDLYYRLNVIPVELPPLRERKEDIPLLAGYFLAQFAKRMNKPMTGIDDAVIEQLLSYSWPGNVRELENTIERAVALSRGDRITQADTAGPGWGWHVGNRRIIPTHIPAAATAVALPSPIANIAVASSVILPANGIDLEKHLIEEERAYIIQALERCNWNLTSAAKLLNMTFRSIRYRVAKLGIERPFKMMNDE